VFEWASVGAGLWLILLFVTRRVWVPSLVRVIYRRRWTRIFLWPFSVGDAESCSQILLALAWGYLFVGALLLVIELTQGRVS